MEERSKVRSYDVKFVAPKYLDAHEKLLLMVFLSMRNLAEIRISVEKLAYETSMGEATVKRKLKSLTEKRFITRTSKGVKNLTVTRVNEKQLEEAIFMSSPSVYERLRKDPLAGFNSFLLTEKA